MVEGEAGEAEELVPSLDRRDVPFDRGVQKELGTCKRREMVRVLYIVLDACCVSF